MSTVYILFLMILEVQQCFQQNLSSAASRNVVNLTQISQINSQEENATLSAELVSPTEVNQKEEELMPPQTKIEDTTITSTVAHKFTTNISTRAHKSTTSSKNHSENYTNELTTTEFSNLKQTEKPPSSKDIKKSFNLNYLYFLLLIIPIAAIPITVYCLRRKSKTKQTKPEEPKNAEEKRLATRSWVFKEPEYEDDEEDST